MMKGDKVIIRDAKIEDKDAPLNREFLEQLNVEIEDIKYLGFQEVIGDEERENDAQVRMIAKIKTVGQYLFI